MWRDEYLLSLRERMQSTLKSGRIKSQSAPSVGDVVLIKDDLPHGCWRLGKLLSLVTSRDGQIRSAKVYLCSGCVIAHPLNLLYPVEASNKCISEQNKMTTVRLLNCQLQASLKLKKDLLEILKSVQEKKTKRALSQ